jgi:serine protease inhibitor
VNFANIDGSTSSVGNSSNDLYAAQDNAEILILPFVADKLAMLFIIPTAGNYCAHLDDIIDTDILRTQLDSAPRISAMVQPPKFKHEFEDSLVEPLENLGWLMYLETILLLWV